MMPPAPKHAEEIFSLAAGVAALPPRQGTNADSGEKSHQGIFFETPAIHASQMWVKWSGTHQVIEWRASEIVLGPTIYLYDGDSSIEEIDQSGDALARYAQGAGVDRPLAESRSSVTSYYDQDALGSVSSLSSPSGALQQTYTFDSFGNETAASGSLTNPSRYTGREFDPETNLYYYRARYYEPNSGRFLSEDPLRFGGGADFYIYVGNRPVNVTDPLGLQQQGSTTVSPPVTQPYPGNPPDGAVEEVIAALEKAASATSTAAEDAAASTTEGLFGLLYLLNPSGSNNEAFANSPEGRFERECSQKKKKKKVDEENCEEMYRLDRAVCKTLPLDERPACYDQAAQRYAACLSPNPERPMPPFPWRRPQ